MSRDEFRQRLEALALAHPEVVQKLKCPPEVVEEVTHQGGRRIMMACHRRVAPWVTSHRLAHYTALPYTSKVAHTAQALQSESASQAPSIVRLATTDKLMAVAQTSDNKVHVWGVRAPPWRKTVGHAKAVAAVAAAEAMKTSKSTKTALCVNTSTISNGLELSEEAT